jgi:hypothetical protein
VITPEEFRKKKAEQDAKALERLHRECAIIIKKLMIVLETGKDAKYYWKKSPLPFSFMWTQLSSIRVTEEQAERITNVLRDMGWTVLGDAVYLGLDPQERSYTVTA